MGHFAIIPLEVVVVKPTECLVNLPPPIIVPRRRTDKLALYFTCGVMAVFILIAIIIVMVTIPNS